MDAEAQGLSALDIDGKSTGGAQCTCQRVCCLSCGCSCGLFVAMLVLVPLSCSTGLAAGSLAWMQNARPELIGSYKVGSIRNRLPAAGDRECGLYAQFHYPLDENAGEYEGQEFPLWRDETINRMFSNYGFPVCLGESLNGAQQPIDPPGKVLASQDGGWPIVVLSPGLSGTVELYQQFARDMASTGAIVVAVEHEDGTMTYATDCSGNEVVYKRSPVDGWRSEMNQRVVDHNATVAAIQATTNALEESIAQTSPVEEVLRAGRADRLILAGHSLGGAGIFNYMQNLTALGVPSPIIGTIFIDLAASPFPVEMFDIPLRDPFVHLNSEGWAQVRGNREESAVWWKKMAQSNPANTLAAAEVKGAIHAWVTESHLFIKERLSRMLGQMGPGDFKTYYANTAQAAKASIEAFVTPALQPGLGDEFAAINPEVFVPYDLGEKKSSAVSLGVVVPI